MKHKLTEYKIKIRVNSHKITKVLISDHYLLKHSAYMNDKLILQLVQQLDNKTFKPDSFTGDVEYFVADIFLNENQKTYRIVWLFEGQKLEILGVINAYRRSTKGSKNE